MNLKKIHDAHAAVLVSSGLFGLAARYVTQGDWQFTALIPAGFGAALLPLSPAVGKGQPAAVWTAAALTATVGSVAVGRLVKSARLGEPFKRRTGIFVVVTTSAATALAAYLTHASRR